MSFAETAMICLKVMHHKNSERRIPAVIIYMHTKEHGGVRWQDVYVHKTSLTDTATDARNHSRPRH